MEIGLGRAKSRIVWSMGLIINLKGGIIGLRQCKFRIILVTGQTPKTESWIIKMR